MFPDAVAFLLALSRVSSCWNSVKVILHGISDGPWRPYIALKVPIPEIASSGDGMQKS